MMFITINLNEERDWGDCPLCDEYRRLDHAVGYYCGPTYDDPGTKLPNGDEVGGRLVCRRCHDAFYYNRPTHPRRHNEHDPG